jgi:hypothetical protein
MSISMKRDELIEYIRFRGNTPPKIVLEADENDVFAWGLSVSSKGFGSQAIHKIGEMRDGKFHYMEPEEEPEMHRVVTIDPIAPGEKPVSGLDFNEVKNLEAL